MTDKQNNPDPIAHAARLLREAAEELRQAHTLSSDRNNWIGEPEAKAAYDEHMAAAQALEDWEAAVGAGGVQALSAVPAGWKLVPAGWKLVPVEPTNDMQKAADEWAAKGFDWPKAVYRAMLAASPTPPAEQQATTGAALGDVYAELLEPDATTYGLGAVWNRHSMRDFADRTHALRMQAAPKAAPGESNTVPAEWLEQAYREGWAACRDAETIGEEAEDWAFGNSTANSRMIDAQQATPQQEAQEPGEIPESIERMATGRYKVVPSHESMFHRWAVVAGSGTQQLYLGREVECQNMARKFAGAFLDGAFVAMQQAAPQPAPAPLSDDAERDAAFEAVRKKLCALPRFSFLSDGYGVRRVPDKSGSWIAFDAAHAMFDPVAVDAALAAQGGK